MHIRRSPEEIAANRARYEEHQRKGLDFAPKALPGFSPLPAPAIDAASIIHREVIPGGWYDAMKVKAGETLRISLDHGFSSLALIAWSAADPSERLNLPDTVKMQWTTGLSKGRVIFSDMGRVMFSITEDSSGAHDCLVGGSSAASNARYGDPMLRDTRDNFVKLALKIGLNRRDIPAMLTLFAPVRVDAEGRFFWNPTLLNGADYIDLRAEMDMTVGFSNCPHPLDPNPAYAPNPVTITRFNAGPVAADDLCRTATAEAVRGFENNALASL
ncbi:urea carboxylase [Rhizobium rhizosphaerae]|uniref:Urea carboxylase n=1 Tax=Xaviernesmea rhizosphaerae TaxID=1672749 RepID=A0ABX3PGV4_9HYPH|nr:urea amidolyase associated protein UAAP1 [Xaviernesmea rhizosphaerae]OQP87405.1 urea carboxylase [Xaviernesmea rhizosphaerae]